MDNGSYFLIPYKPNMVHVYTLQILYKHIVILLAMGMIPSGIYVWIYGLLGVELDGYGYVCRNRKRTSSPIQYGTSRTPWKLIEFESQCFLHYMVSVYPYHLRNARADNPGHASTRGLRVLSLPAFVCVSVRPSVFAVITCLSTR